MKDERITIAKGIAIILMVVGHSLCPEKLGNFISLFHMPLFFFCSGYCFKEKYLTDFIGFLKKRFRGLCVPYIKWGLFFLLLNGLLVYVHILPEDASIALSSYPKIIFDIIFQTKGVSMMLGGYWFLGSLFYGSLIFWFVRKTICKEKIIMGVILLSLALVLSYLRGNIHAWNFNWLNFYAAFFIWLGYWYKESGYQLEKNKYFLLSSFCLLFLVACSFSISMTSCTWKLIIPYALFAFLGTLFTLSWSSWFAIEMNARIKRLFIYIGENTLTILTWHFLSFKIMSLVLVFLFSLSLSKLEDFPTIKEYSFQGWWVLYAMIGVMVPLLGKQLFVKLKKVKSKL